MPPKQQRRRLPLPTRGRRSTIGKRPTPPKPIPRKRPVIEKVKANTQGNTTKKIVSNVVTQENMENEPITKKTAGLKTTGLTEEDLKDAMAISSEATDVDKVNDDIVLVKQGQEIDNENILQDLDRSMCKGDIVSARQGEVFSVLSLLQHSEDIRNFFCSLFGIGKDRVTKGLSIDDADTDILLDFLSLITFGKMFKDVDQTEIDKCVLFNITPYDKGVPGTQVKELNVSFQSVLRLVYKHQLGWLNDEILDIFSDAMNFSLGAKSTDQKETLPSICFIKQIELEHLWAFSPMAQNRPTISLEDKFFSKKLETAIVKGHGRNQVAHIIKEYKAKSKDTNDIGLNKLLGIINLNKNHFVQVTIDFKHQRIITRDPMNKQKDGSMLRRKWLAKMCSISHHLLASDKSLNIYLGNQDMLVSPSFTEKIKTQMSEHESHKFMFYHQNNNNEKVYPKQNDLLNCGIYSLWYNLIETFGHGKMCSIDPQRWRNQMLVFLVVLKMYYEKWSDRLYTFPKEFDMQTWILSHNLPENVISVFTDLFQTREDETNSDEDSEEGLPETLVPTTYFMQTLDMFKFMNKFLKSYGKKKNIFFSNKLKSIVEDSNAFPRRLKELSTVPYYEVNVTVNWNFNKHNRLKEKFIATVREIFQEPSDSIGINYVVTKENTIFLSMTAKAGIEGTSNKSEYIAFAALTPIYLINIFQGFIIDYIGTTDKSPHDILPSYTKTTFSGKGIAKFLINMVQVLGYALSNEDLKHTQIILKAAEDKAAFYTHMGFREVTKDTLPLLNSNTVKQHYEAQQLHPSMKSFVLDDNKVIDHNQHHFINHVYQDYRQVSYVAAFDKKITPQVHSIFKQEKIAEHFNSVFKSDDNPDGGFSVPIGDVVAEIFQSIKPVDFVHSANLYQYFLEKISWQITVKRDTRTPKKRKTSIDIVHNPKGYIHLFCNACGECYSSPFSLRRHKYSNNNESTIAADVKSAVEWFFDLHFDISNRAQPSPIRCEDLDLNDMKEKRDEEMFALGHNEHMQNVNAKLFEKLIQIFVQVHLERRSILDFFDWQNFRPTKYGRQVTLFSLKRKQLETVDAVLGKNEKNLREATAKKNEDKINVSRIKKSLKDWESLWDDLIFVNNLRSIRFVKQTTLNDRKFEELKQEVSNPGTLNRWTDHFWIGYVDVERNDEENDEWILFKKGMGAGAARVLQWKWLKENLETSFIRTIKDGQGRAVRLPAPALKTIRDDIVAMRAKNITHIYKYTCPTTYEIKFCNAIEIRNNRKARNATQRAQYEAIKTDIVTREWLYMTAVKLNNCEEWFKEVIDPKTTDKYFSLPTAAVSGSFGSIPEEVEGAPRLQFPQLSRGICGISALSSAFYYNYDRKLSFNIYEKRQEYLQVLGEEMYGKRSPAMKFLIDIIMQQQKVFKKYTVQRMKKPVGWRDLCQNPYYNNIVLCIPKSSSFAKDHIVGITKGWIFDGNLSYALPLTEENLTWSTTHGKGQEVFSQFVEQVQVLQKR